MPDDYAYINTRVRIMRTKLLDGRSLDSALAAGSYQEFLRVLSETDLAANLRDTMLRTGQVDAVTGFLFTVHFNLVGLGIPEDNILSWPYAEHGLDLYGSGVFVRAEWLERNQEAAARFVKASIDGLKALLNDVPGGMAALKRREALFDEALETRRFAMTRDRSIITPNSRAGGMGHLDMARAQQLVQVNAEALGVANPPSAESMFTDRYLPPKSERMF